MKQESFYDRANRVKNGVQDFLDRTGMTQKTFTEECNSSRRDGKSLCQGTISKFLRGENIYSTSLELLEERLTYFLAQEKAGASFVSKVKEKKTPKPLMEKLLRLEQYIADRFDQIDSRLDYLLEKQTDPNAKSPAKVSQLVARN